MSAAGAPLAPGPVLPPGEPRVPIERRSPHSRASSRFLTGSLVLFLAIVFVLAYIVFQPFLLDTAVAGAVALMLGPINDRLSRLFRGRRTLAALALSSLLVVLLLLPLVSYGALVVSQTGDVMAWIKPRLEPQAMRALLAELPDRYPLVASAAATVGIDRERLTEYASPALSSLAAGVSHFMQRTVARVGSALFELLVFLAVLFFLLRDGHRIGAQIRRISPLSDKQLSDIGTHLAQTVKGVLQAMVLVPLAQGLLAMIGFWIFGVPSPFFWGACLVLAALVPGVGSLLVWVPAVVYLFLNGNTGAAIGLLVYGTLIISTADNVLKSILMGGTAGIHPLLAFLSTIGGILAFGPSGFIVGPIVLSLLLSVVRIYELDVIGARAAARAEAAAEAAAAEVSGSHPAQVAR